MNAECYRVTVPEGRRLTGFTAAGLRVPILPGEYLVHRLRPRGAPQAGTALRFVAAHGGDNDVHIKLPEGVDPGRALSVKVEPVQDL